ncbi:hypothetical protein AKJ16_DCAP11801 [Drosera capensis]
MDMKTAVKWYLFLVVGRICEDSGRESGRGDQSCRHLLPFQSSLLLRYASVFPQASLLRGEHMLYNRVPLTHGGLYRMNIIFVATLKSLDDLLQVFAKVKAYFVRPDAHRTGISTRDAAMMLGMAPAMVEEHLLHAETKVFPSVFSPYFEAWHLRELASRVQQSGMDYAAEGKVITPSVPLSL